jgi:hypothetical protein
MGKAAWFAVAVAVVAVAGAARGQMSAPGTQTATTQAQVDVSRWQPVVKQLGSEEFAVREAAQRELEKAGMKDREALKALAEGTKDAEVKARLMKRSEALEEEAAVNPPGISIDVKDASLTEVAAALNEATGAGFTAIEGSMEGVSYTLKAVDEPFWDVFMKLNQQGEFAVQSVQGLRLRRTTGGMRRGVVSGAFLIYGQSLAYQRMADLQRDAGEELQPGRLTLSFGVAVDPRVQVVAYAPVMTSVKDDLGNELVKAGGRAAVVGPLGVARRQWTMVSSCELEIVPGGKKIVLAKGTVRATVIMAQAKVQVDDLEKQGNTPVGIGGREVVFTKFDMKDGRLSVSANVDSAGRVAGVPEAGVALTLLDANDQTVYTTNLLGNFGGTFGGQHKAPIKAVLTLPTKTKEIEVPFELKDLPLPAP